MDKKAEKIKVKQESKAVDKKTKEKSEKKKSDKKVKEQNTLEN